MASDAPDRTYLWFREPGTASPIAFSQPQKDSDGDWWPLYVKADLPTIRSWLAEQGLAVVPTSGPEFEDGVERAAKAAWNHADDEIGWEATNSLAATGEPGMQFNVDWVREEAALAIRAFIGDPT